MSERMPDNQKTFKPDEKMISDAIDSLDRQALMIGKALAAVAAADEKMMEIPKTAHVSTLINIAVDYLRNVEAKQERLMKRLFSTLHYLQAEKPKLECPQAPVELTASEGTDAYRDYIIELIYGISGEKELRAILFLVRRCLENEAEAPPVKRLRSLITHQLTWIKSEEGLYRISRYIDRHWVVPHHE